MDLYSKIKNKRLQLGLSQDDLALKTGYKDRSSIAKIEKGQVDLSISKVEEFAKVLKTTPAYLMGWEDKEEKKLKTVEDLDFTGIERIAAEHKGENFTQEELKFIQDTINFVVAKKRKLNKKDGQPND